ncbi:MAG: hypothetical protein ACK4UN_00750 [Limisphaerales bacterium]
MGLRKVIIGLGIIGITVLVILFIFFQSSPAITIKVQDASGQPVAGAVVKPNGLRSRGGASAFAWADIHDPKPTPVLTDERGEVRVKYPRFVMERVATGTIIFDVDHPDYVWFHGEQVVDHSPPPTAGVLGKLKHVADRLMKPEKFRVRPIVLDSGAVVKAWGYMGEEQNRITNQLYADSSRRHGWQLPEPGVLMSKRFQPGTNHLRLVHFPETGRTHYSEVISFPVAGQQTSQFNLKLKPGHRLKVRLSNDVPRPVTNGRVILCIGLDRTIDPRPPVWREWKELDPDGSCIFESLPPGKVEITGICDGFVSASGSTIAPRFSVQAQPLELQADAVFELKMEPAATCELLVLDADRKPLPDAKVYFWPNVSTGGIFGQPLKNSAEVVRAGPDRVESKIEVVLAITSADGRAVVKNLPGFGQQQFAVEHADHQMPSGDDGWRHGTVWLMPGETSTITVVMEKKGDGEVEYVH